MTELEFEVLDELYFMVSFQDLTGQLTLTESELLEVLELLAAKEWIRVYDTSQQELNVYDLKNEFKTYFYLASKKGLFAHNS